MDLISLPRKINNKSEWLNSGSSNTSNSNSNSNNNNSSQQLCKDYCSVSVPKTEGA